MLRVRMCFGTRHVFLFFFAFSFFSLHMKMSTKPVKKHKTKNAVNFTAPSILFQLNLPDNFTALYRPPWFCVWGASKWWGGTNFEHLGRIESTFLKNVFPFSKVLRFQQFSMICCDLGLVYFFQSQIFLCLIKIKKQKTQQLYATNLRLRFRLAGKNLCAFSSDEGLLF